MEISFSVLTTLISLLIAFGSLVYVVKNNKRTDIKEIEQKASENAKMNMKLDEISRNVSDIKYDNSALRKDMVALSERVTSVEASAKSAHKRIDDIQKG